MKTGLHAVSAGRFLYNITQCYIILHNITHQNEYYPIWPNTTKYASILHIMKWFDAALDGQEIEISCGSRITIMRWHRTGLLKDRKVSILLPGVCTSACPLSSKTGTREQHRQWMCPRKDPSLARLSSIWLLHWLTTLYTLNFIAYWVKLVILCNIRTYCTILKQLIHSW